MNEFEKLYQEKLTTAEEAVKIVKSGDWVDYSHASQMPVVLDKALAARAGELEDVNVRGYLLFHPLAIMEANEKEDRNVFTWNSWYLGGYDRKVKRDGVLFHAPMRFAQLPEYYRREEDVESLDVLFLQTGRMDKFGYFNLGPSIAHSWSLIQRAKKIVVEANDKMPYVNGAFGDMLHIRDIDAVIETSTELDTIPDSEPGELDKKIAEIVMPYVHDRATLQLGIGGMPNAVGSMIAESDLKDLSIHSEMYVDSMMKMTKAGKITGKFNEIHPGKQMFAFSTGTKDLYDFLDHNPEMIAAPVDFVNDPSLCGQMKKFTSINNAVNIDLFGQVNGESSGTKQISGTGGQLDFVLGAYKSDGGISIIALSSTFKNKKGEVMSRILPTLAQGSTVTDPRTTTGYIATEYGIYNLKGKSMWQRAEGLINIAHPDFRDQLIKDAEKMGIWRRSNKR